MIRTGFDARLEHVFAYFIATVAVSLAYPRLHPLQTVGMMIFYAAVAGMYGLTRHPFS